MGKIRDLEIRIREYINHYRQTHVLVQNLVKWNILCSSLDVVGDTELALGTYRALKEEKDDGFNYLAVYGVLQVLYVQQDAVRHIFESLDVSLKLVNPAKFSDIRYVREIRNKATGHPTKLDKNRPVSSHYISRISLSLSGFTLMSAEGAKTEFNEINIPELLQKQEAAVTHALEIVVDVLGKRENEHKMKFKGKTVTSIFPGHLSYFFEKIFEGTISDNSGRWEWGRVHVESLIEVVGKLREAFVERAVLPASDVIERDLQGTEYALQKLKGYYDSAPDNNLNDKDAYIYTFYLRHQFEQLKKLASEVDQEFQTGEGAAT